MGHSRLGGIPKSQKWDAVVAAVSGFEPTQAGEDQRQQIASIARRTLEAAAGGLSKATEDPTLVFSWYLLSRAVVSSRESDWTTQLADLGIDLDPDSTLFDLVAGIQGAVEGHLRAASERRSDVGEMALQALGEAMANLAGSRVESLFEGSLEDVQSAVKGLSTRAGFGRLGQAFYGRFLARFLNFYLSRVTAAEVGRSETLGALEVASFNRALLRHCEESALILQRYAGEWMSVREYEGGIDATNSAAFVGVALKKLKRELQRQGSEG